MFGIVMELIIDIRNLDPDSSFFNIVLSKSEYGC